MFSLGGRYSHWRRNIPLGSISSIFISESFVTSDVHILWLRVELRAFCKLKTDNSEPTTASHHPI